MIASAQTIRKLHPIYPFSERREVYKTNGSILTYGLSPAGYDIRIAQHVNLLAGGFQLASTVEDFIMPNNLLGVVHDKSSWARKGLAVQNTVIEPGWRGYLTLELTNHSIDQIDIDYLDPIAQIIFHLLDEDTEMPYSGKYQNQPPGPQPAK